MFSLWNKGKHHVIFISIWETHWVMWRFHVTWETNSSTENVLSDNINKCMNSHDFLQHCFLYLYVTGLRKKAANHGGDTGGFVKLCNVKKSCLCSQCHSTGHSTGQVQLIILSTKRKDIPYCMSCDLPCDHIKQNMVSIDALVSKILHPKKGS